MGEQSSICVQKRTILALTTIIFAMTIYLFKFKIDNFETLAATANIDDLEIINENDDDITSENAKFAAAQVVEEIASGDAEDATQNDASTVASAKVEEKNVASKNVSHETKTKSVAPAEYARVVEATSTAYCLCQKCCGKPAGSAGYGVTASGYKIVPGSGDKVIAVDPNVIPLGTKVYVENAGRGWDYGYAIAADTGSAINGMKVDLYMDTHDEALGWGKRNVKVYVIE